MIALREGATKLNHEHFHSGIAEGSSSDHAFDPFCFSKLMSRFLSSPIQEEERPHVLRIDDAIRIAPLFSPFFPIHRYNRPSESCLKPGVMR